MSFTSISNTIYDRKFQATKNDATTRSYFKSLKWHSLDGYNTFKSFKGYSLDVYHTIKQWWYLWFVHECYFRPFKINNSFNIKMKTTKEMRNVVIIWLFREFIFHLFHSYISFISFIYFIYFIHIFHLFSFACYRIKFLLSIFSFNCNFDFFNQWWQIIKRNAVLFTKKLRSGKVMMNEWLIMSGFIYFRKNCLIILRKNLSLCPTCWECEANLNMQFYKAPR